VIAPEGTPLEGAKGLLAYLQRKRRWIFDAVREIEEKHRQLLTQRYASGAKLQYRGRWLMLDVQAVDAPTVQIQCRSKFHVAAPKHLEGVERMEAIRTSFHEWLRRRAERDMRLWGQQYESALSARAEGYRLSNAKGRWGSLGQDNVIRIHWRLVQAPKAAMEYVVAHEVAHLFERNHGPRFWSVLAKAMPDWEERKTMLERWEHDHRAV
jgi:predicted metal-dependent hydrolase